MIAGGHGNEHPNSDWIRSRGFYLFYLIFLSIFHLILLSLPFISTPYAWTITNLSHNLVRIINKLIIVNIFHSFSFKANFYFLHIVKGSPWELVLKSGKYKRETHFEQLDYGAQFTHQKKFLTMLPIILFLLTCLYTKNSEAHFLVNFLSLILVTIPKLPRFHHVRLFNINKY